MAAAPPRLIVCRRSSAPHRLPPIISPRLFLRGSSSIAVAVAVAVASSGSRHRPPLLRPRLFLRGSSSIAVSIAVASSGSRHRPPMLRPRLFLGAVRLTTMFLPRLFFVAATPAALPQPQILPWRLILRTAAAPSSPSLRQSPRRSCYSRLPGRGCGFRSPLPRSLMSSFDDKITPIGSSLLPYYLRILPCGRIIMRYDSGLDHQLLCAPVQHNKLPVSILRSTAQSKGIVQPKPRKLSSFLKMGLFTVVVVISGVTYFLSAFTLDEIEEKTKALRTLSKFSVQEDATFLEKIKALLFASAIKITIRMAIVYMKIRKVVENGIEFFTSPPDKLLPELTTEMKYMLTLVLDLEETLVKSEWKRFDGWRVYKRPGVNVFLEHLGRFYEIVVYSDQPDEYVINVVRKLDTKGNVRYMLGKKSTKYVKGKHSQDLSKLNRDCGHIIYISGQPYESSLQPENTVSIKPWKLENDDTALLDLIPFLEYLAIQKPDTRQVLASYQGQDIPNEFQKRSEEHERLLESIFNMGCDSRQKENSQHHSFIGNFYSGCTFCQIFLVSFFIFAE